MEVHILLSMPMWQEEKLCNGNQITFPRPVLLIQYDLIIDVMPTSKSTFLNGTFVSSQVFFFCFFFIVS